MTAYPPILTFDQMSVASAVWHVQCARNHVFVAHCNIDAAGFSCDALSDLYADAAALVADWHDRPVPSDPDMRRLWNPCDPSSGEIPDWMVRAATEWRGQKRRSY